MTWCWIWWCTCSLGDSIQVNRSKGFWCKVLGSRWASWCQLADIMLGLYHFFACCWLLNRKRHCSLIRWPADASTSLSSTSHIHLVWSWLIMTVPATWKSILGDRAFAVAGPRAQNNLPDNIRHFPSLATFKHSLKSHLFLQCFLLLRQLWLCAAPLKWLCVIYGTLQIDYFTLHYITWQQ